MEPEGFAWPARIVLAFLLAFFVACGVATLLLQPAHAQEPSAKCGPYAEIKAKADGAGMTQQAALGLMDKDHLMVVLSTPMGVNWLMVMVNAHDQACIVAQGNWWSEPAYLPRPGDWSM